MLTKIKNIANTEDKKRLLSNFFSLATLQGANYILPLITLPYLVRVLGVEYFGLLAFAGATIAYFNIITDYGFNLTATREISIHRDNKEKVIEIFSSVMTIKVILMMFSFLLMAILVFSFEKFSEHWEVYFLTFGTVIGQVIFPVWFFQGMERMKYITYLNILAKSIFTVAIFVFVHEQSDFWIVPLLTSVGFIIAGIWSLWIVKKDFEVNFKFQISKTLKYYIIDGWYVFISRIAVNLYSSTNMILLGLLFNNTLVGYYSIAEKLAGATQSIGIVFTTAIFPYLSSVWHKGKERYYRKFFQLFKILLIGMVLISIFVFIFASDLMYLLSGKDIIQSIIVLKILSISIVLSPLGSIFTENFITQKKSIYVTKATVYTAIFNLVLVYPFLYFYNIYGLAILTVLVQIFQVLINSKYLLEVRRG
jgi:PST family polysaccharide transporter